MTPDISNHEIERLARDAGGMEYGPRTWNMSFKRDALHAFARSLIDHALSAGTTTSIKAPAERVISEERLAELNATLDQAFDLMSAPVSADRVVSLRRSRS
ncbi:hypothetical protein NKJ09_22935 [Mesorhizobium sp. M0189]|uniref:hypothetical protein n=1 Tax=Mesorhizobium sp. M0189 TaxID=2956909 RepID=UPI00333D92B6